MLYPIIGTTLIIFGVLAYFDGLKISVKVFRIDKLAAIARWDDFYKSQGGQSFLPIHHVVRLDLKEV